MVIKQKTSGQLTQRGGIFMLANVFLIALAASSMQEKVFV